MQRLAIPCLVLTLAAAPAAAGSKAADWLVNQELAAACPGGGTIDPAAVIERDLTGDGKADLIISHEGITCAGGGRSSFCGVQVCALNFYVRRGKLLEPALEALGAGVRVGDGAIPVIHSFAHGGAPVTRRWDGETFR